MLKIQTTHTKQKKNRNTSTLHMVGRSKQPTRGDAPQIFRIFQHCHPPRYIIELNGIIYRISILNSDIVTYSSPVIRVPHKNANKETKLSKQK